MKTIITIILAFTVSAVCAQAKPDSTKYTLNEAQIAQISRLLSFSDSAVGNSDKITTRDYNEFHRQVMQIDSVLRVQYAKKHPKKDAKKP